MSHARIVGAGLIGTSIALGLSKEGWTIEISDKNARSAALAHDLLQGSLSVGSADLVVVATPPNEVVATLKSEFAANPKATFIDTASVKTNVLQEVEALPALARQFVGSHPMAGREIGGAQSAQGDLFRGRAWILTPTSLTSKSAIELVEKVIADLGATAYHMTASQHDELLARISHLPQLISTALATTVIRGNGIELAGQGLRDMTRLANSDGGLWSEILIGNKEEISRAIKEFVAILKSMDSSIQSNDLQAIRSTFDTGRESRNLISGKHGKQARPYNYLRIVIEDRPGQLSKIISDCSTIEANIEDLSIEHSPGQFTGLITLAFLEEDAERVHAHLMNQGWNVHLA